MMMTTLINVEMMMVIVVNLFGYSMMNDFVTNQRRAVTIDALH